MLNGTTCLNLDYCVCNGVITCTGSSSDTVLRHLIVVRHYHTVSDGLTQNFQISNAILSFFENSSSDRWATYHDWTIRMCFQISNSHHHHHHNHHHHHHMCTPHVVLLCTLYGFYNFNWKSYIVLNFGFVSEFTYSNSTIQKSHTADAHDKQTRISAGGAY